MDFRTLYSNTPKVEIDCPVCGCGRRHVILERDRHKLGLPLGICTNCGMGYICRRPPDEWIATFYRDHYWRLYTGGNLRAEAESSLVRSGEILGSYSLPEVARCLDVGCGSGGMLRIMRERFGRAEVIGVDPSKDAIELCRDRFGFRIEEIGPDMQIPTGIGQFDLITAIHVLEHLTRPADFVAQVRRLLAPGGAFILDVPDLLSDRWQGTQFIHIAHLNYFHEAPLVRLLAANGLKVTAVRRGSAANWPWAIGMSSTVGCADVPDGCSVEAIRRHVKRRIRPTWRSMLGATKQRAAGIPLIGPALLRARRALRGVVQRSGGQLLN